MDDLGPVSPPPTRHTRRRNFGPRDALVTILIAAVIIGAGTLVVRRSLPHDIATFVGRFGGMTAQEEHLEARMMAVRHAALAHVVLQLDREPGLESLVWPDASVPWGHVPDLTLFDDGRVVYLDESHGDARIPFEVQLDQTAAQVLVDQIVALGFDRLHSQETQTVSDGGFEDLRLRRNGALVALRIYDQAELTTDPSTFHAVVDYLRGWADPQATVLDPGSAVLYDMGRTANAMPVSKTPIEVAVAPDTDQTTPLDWPADVAPPTRFPAFIEGDALAAVRSRLPVAGKRLGGRDVGAYPAPDPAGAAADTPAAVLAPESGFWGWTFRVPDSSGAVHTARLVAVPWIYGDLYPDGPADLADVEDTRAEIVAARADALATETALQSAATSEAALRPAATPTMPGADANGDYPFPPMVHPDRLATGLGIQTWDQWMPDSRPVIALKVEATPRFLWLKQRYAWRDLEPTGPTTFESNELMGQPDSWIGAAKMASVDFPSAHVLIQLDVPPAWAKRTSDVPFDLDAWGRFVHQFARRYAGKVDAYEVMNEPNLAREWGGTPNPAAYAQVLAAAYRAIKTADPRAVVVSAGLAPTGTQLPDAMGDDEFLSRLYDTIAASGGDSNLYFDVLGAHAPGYAAEPSVSPDEAAATVALGGQRYFTFRRVEDLRRIMVQRGDDAKQIAVTEFGWTTDTRPDSPYHWFAVSEGDRAERIRAAYDFAGANWTPWLGPLILFTAADPAWTPDHEASWWAVADGAGNLRPEVRAAFGGK